MADQSYLDPGMDLVAEPCITKSNVQQAIALAQPKAAFGFVVQGQSAPDVITYPVLARFLWVELNASDIPTGNLFYYDGTTWTLLSVLNPNNIINGSITLTKLSVSGGAPYDIIQINAAATGLIFTSIVNAITNGSLPLAKLVGTGDVLNNYIFAGISGVNQFIQITTIPGLLSDNSIPIMKLVRGGESAYGLLLTTSADGTLISWNVFDAQGMIPDADIFIAKLASAITSSGPSSLLGQSIRRNSSNNGWEWYNPATAEELDTIIDNTEIHEITAALDPNTFTGPASVVISTPNIKMYQAFTRCLTDNFGFTVGMEVPLASWISHIDASDDYVTAYFNPVITPDTLTIHSRGPRGIAIIDSNQALHTVGYPDPTKWEFLIRYLSDS